MCETAGSAEWLQANAWFSCEYCEDSDEPTVHHASELRSWEGMTICDDCWSGNAVKTLPERWTELDPFEPFKFLKVTADNHTDVSRAGEEL